MKCPFCGYEDSKVIDSRHAEDGFSIRRRRECLSCQKRFTTHESLESQPIIVVKRDGSRQNFDRTKVINSMMHAFDKRQVDIADLDRIATEIEQTLQNTLSREVSTDHIGELVMARIKPLDEVAYIRFASVYRRFQDVQSFIHEINQFLEEK
ncbi:MAG: transcriptional repressor NrdR [Ruminococcaceae bacterium]|nr:transcriptional repressor NrdR [Oscillospiraceae bacterium]